MPPLDQLYFAWLYGQVASVENRNLSRTYWKLLRILFTKEFVWSHPRDANFAQYGVDLRRTFVDDTKANPDEDPGFFIEPCDMLELMVALALKLEFDDLEGRDAKQWFWELMGNLGLKDFNDAKIREEDTGYIHGVLDQVLNRDYTSKGEGGLFPLRRSRKNQRQVELYYQLESYLAERV